MLLKPKFQFNQACYSVITFSFYHLLIDEVLGHKIRYGINMILRLMCSLGLYFATGMWCWIMSNVYTSVNNKCISNNISLNLFTFRSLWKNCPCNVCTLLSVDLELDFDWKLCSLCIVIQSFWQRLWVRKTYTSNVIAQYALRVRYITAAEVYVVSKVAECCRRCAPVIVTKSIIIAQPP